MTIALHWGAMLPPESKRPRLKDLCSESDRSELDRFESDRSALSAERGREKSQGSGEDQLDRSSSSVQHLNPPGRLFVPRRDEREADMQQTLALSHNLRFVDLETRP